MNIEYKYGQIIKGLCGNIRILFNDGGQEKEKASDWLISRANQRRGG